MKWIDTHCHIDGEEFDEDREAVIERAREAGVGKVLVPAIDLATSQRILKLCSQYPDYLYPMVGMHPEEVRSDWRQQLAAIKSLIVSQPSALNLSPSSLLVPPSSNIIAIGEVGLDFYWSREYEQQQLEAFRLQVEWACRTRLPLMIHCRRAQNELVRILKRYADRLPGGVFHCFTGNELEARELLQFPGFVLGVGGVLTFKKSHLPDVLPAAVPLNRLVLETDSPYMAPVPLRGQRNEPAYVTHVLARMAQAYGIGEAELAERTNENVERIFRL